MFQFPDRFIKTQTDLHGAAGLAWLQRLPTIARAAALRWNLTLDTTLQPLTYNFLIGAHRADQSSVILKICSPTGEFIHERAALLHFDGRGAVCLLGSDVSDEVLLLESCQPGTGLGELPDEQAIVIAAATMLQLWRALPGNHIFPTVDDQAKGIARLRQHYRGTGPFPADLVERAERTFADTGMTSGPPVLLHGDLHHDNILAAQRQHWLAIDPKGVAGDRVYETGSILLNQTRVLQQAPHPGLILARRVDRLAGELEFNRTLIREWGIARAVLSAWWTLEDHGHVGDFALACARALSEQSN